MLLQEEYLNRHNIVIPVVNHTLRDGCVLIKYNHGDKKPTRYIIDVRWVDEGNHPGSYQINYRKPVHNAGGRRDMFVPINETVVVPYDEYEDYFLRFSRENPSASCPKNLEESIFYMWETFVSCFDSWFAGSATLRTLNKIEATIDDGVTDPVKRHQAIQTAIEAIMQENLAVFERWDGTFLPYARKNFHWLARMLKGD